MAHYCLVILSETSGCCPVFVGTRLYFLSVTYWLACKITALRIVFWIRLLLLSRSAECAIRSIILLSYKGGSHFGYLRLTLLTNMLVQPIKYRCKYQTVWKPVGRSHWTWDYICFPQDRIEIWICMNWALLNQASDTVDKQPQYFEFPSWFE
jgi:hypothetical protein